MDLQNNLTVADTGVPGGGAVDAIASGVKNLATSVRNKAKAKKAQKISDAGGYFTLTPFQKSLINEPDYAKTTIGAKSDEPIEAIANQGFEIKKYIPYIIGVVVIIIIYFVVKSKK